LIGEQGISHFLALPSFYAQILEQLQQPALACVIVAGEACPLELPARHAERLPQTLLVNEYGPSESSVWCSAHTVQALPAMSGCRSVAPLPAPACGCSMNKANWSASAARASFTWVARAWPVDTCSALA
jgi:non-ribosomal peptide synthetase component F